MYRDPRLEFAEPIDSSLPLTRAVSASGIDGSEKMPITYEVVDMNEKPQTKDVNERVRILARKHISSGFSREFWSVYDQDEQWQRQIYFRVVMMPFEVSENKESRVSVLEPFACVIPPNFLQLQRDGEFNKNIITGKTIEVPYLREYFDRCMLQYLKGSVEIERNTVLKDIEKEKHLRMVASETRDAALKEVAELKEQLFRTRNALNGDLTRVGNALEASEKEAAHFKELYGQLKSEVKK
jgi:hypothetical protein